MKSFLGSVLAASLAATQVQANIDVMMLALESRVKLGTTYQRDISLRPSSVKNAAVTCENGVAVVDGETFECDNVDFLSFVSAAELKISEPQSAGDSSDIWGWVSPTGAEITILTLDNGVVLLNSTDPVDPCIIAKLPSARSPSAWGDVKVFKNVAYTIKDRGSFLDQQPEIGVEIYDLLKFDELNCHEEGFVVEEYASDNILPQHGHTHNVIVNTESGKLFTVGATVCKGGPIIWDLNEDPLHPKYLGCIQDDGYTHDMQCVNYDGPDSRYTGKEICVCFNEKHMTIWDITDFGKEDGGYEMVSRVTYDNQAYCHQGWLTRDMSKVLMDDELDEECNVEFISTCRSMVLNPDALQGYTNTTTYIFDINDLENPVLERAFIHETISIDHNLYVWGAIHEKGWGGIDPARIVPNPDLAFLNNYMSGLRVMDIAGSDASAWKQVGYFDITPAENSIEFLGAWSGYLFPSGVYAISSIERGMFFLWPKFDFVDLDTGKFVTKEVPTFTPAAPTPAPTLSTPPTPTTPPSLGPTIPFGEEGSSDDGNGMDSAVGAIVAIAVVINIVLMLLIFKEYKKNQANKQSPEGTVAQQTL